eukprot:COSAG06_NODE_70122_length_193_cov_898.095745_1_plen_35_part_10
MSKCYYDMTCLSQSDIWEIECIICACVCVCVRVTD